MTKEAIKFFEHLISETERVLADRPEKLREVETVLPYYRMAIKALEKQIPKKVDYEDDNEVYASCPVCSHTFVYDTLYDENWSLDYCPDCGQSLKWEDRLI